MKNDKIQLSKLVDMENPRGVLDEVKTIVFMLFGEFDFEPLSRVFRDVVKLFRGEYPGYQRCNTEYHDLRHTTDTMLAMIRLIHGVVLHEETLCQKHIALGIVGALFHDTGYIHTQDDISGTGAKYTLVHVQRSIEFMDKYFRKKNLPREDFKSCRDILKCTSLNIKINEIQFKSREIELLGKMLGTADILGQMADRTYLEKLLFLFYEFQEGNVEGCTQELDILKKTASFYDTTKKRLVCELGGVNKYMIYHFKERWKIDGDLYEDAIEKNINYLKYILATYKKKYREYLRRGGYVKKLYKKGL